MTKTLALIAALVVATPAFAAPEAADAKVVKADAKEVAKEVKADAKETAKEVKADAKEAAKAAAEKPAAGEMKKEETK